MYQANPRDPVVILGAVLTHSLTSAPAHSRVWREKRVTNRNIFSHGSLLGIAPKRADCLDLRSATERQAILELQSYLSFGIPLIHARIVAPITEAMGGPELQSTTRVYRPVGSMAN